MRVAENAQCDLNEQYARAEILSTIRTSLQCYRDVHASGNSCGGDLRFTLLITWAPHDDVSEVPYKQQQPEVHVAVGKSQKAIAEEGSHLQTDLVNVYMHTERLPLIPKRPIVCEVRGAPRENAEAKNSKWVKDRVCNSMTCMNSRTSRDSCQVQPNPNQN